MRPGHNLIKGALSRLVPMPGVLKRLDLRGGLLPVWGLEQHVVIRIRVERRVQLNEVNALGRDALPKHREVVAIKELVRHSPSNPQAVRASRFLYDPRFFAGASAASTRATISATSQRRSDTPAAMAGVTRSVLWMRTKL